MPVWGRTQDADPRITIPWTNILYTKKHLHLFPSSCISFLAIVEECECSERPQPKAGGVGELTDLHPALEAPLIRIAPLGQKVVTPTTTCTCF